MRNRWGRICRIRQIEEDQARIAVESAVAALRRNQAGVEYAVAAERDARTRRNACLREAGAESGNWIEPEAEAQINRVLAVRRAYFIPTLEGEIGASRDVYLERRRERQKVESLTTQAAAKQQLENQRRTSLEIDDLFQARRWYDWMRIEEGQG